MASVKFSVLVFMAIMVASMQFRDTTAQTRHVVGDSIGWTIPSDGAAAYTNWASRQTFMVGDTLVFNFTNGAHDVAEVQSASYEPCNSNNPISLSTNGPATITLASAGTHYYICTFSSHCQLGQKLTINVTNGNLIASPPSATTMPPPNNTATPPTTSSDPCPPTSSPTSSPPSTTGPGTGTRQPPLISGALSLATVPPTTILMIGLVFLNY